MRFVGTALIFLTAMLASCGDAGSASDLVGMWARQGPDKTVAQVYLNLKTGGAYRLYHDGMEEAGRYSLDGRSISFSGQSLAFMGWKQVWRLPDTKHLVIDRTVGVPGGQKMSQSDSWIRVSLKPYFDEQVSDGQPIPSGLPKMVNIMLAVARGAYPDMMPAALQLSVDPQTGGQQIQLDMQSAKTQRGIHVEVVRYSLAMADYALRGSWGALPPDFVDLPQALAIARKAGLQGPLKTASLNDWKGTPAWIIAGNGRGVTVHALTGAVIQGDVTGTIKSYNEDWDKAVKNLQRLAPKQFDADKAGVATMFRRQQADADYQRHVSAVVCESDGGRWGGYACY